MYWTGETAPESSVCGAALLLLLAVSPATALPERAECIDAAAARYEIPVTLSSEVFRAAEANGVAPDLFYSLIQSESGFRPGVVSGAGAVGLAQVKPSTARAIRPGLERWELFDPRTNLDVGAAYLARLLDRYGGDVERALRAYNVGPSRLARAHRTGEPDGREYARRVLNGI